jgi:hypothetical protein
VIGLAAGIIAVATDSGDDISVEENEEPIMEM